MLPVRVDQRYWRRRQLRRRQLQQLDDGGLRGTLLRCRTLQHQLRILHRHTV